MIPKGKSSPPAAVDPDLFIFIFVFAESIGIKKIVKSPIEKAKTLSFKNLSFYNNYFLYPCFEPFLFCLEKA
jgi:hypothetical protein